MKPSIGRIVHYKLSEQDAQDINRRRHDFSAMTRTHPRPGHPGAPGSTGHIGHFGNAVRPGDVFPAMIVKVWEFPESGVNLQVHLDGNDTFWATSRKEGDDQAQWSWSVKLVSPDVKISSGLTAEQIEEAVRQIQAALLKQARRGRTTSFKPPEDSL